MYSRANRAAALALAGMLAAGSVSDGINPVHTVQAAEQTKEVAVDAAVQEHTDEIKEEIKYERIDISTPEEFAAFASQCYIDAWSKNKYNTAVAQVVQLQVHNTAAAAVLVVAAAHYIALQAAHIVTAVGNLPVQEQ